MSHKISSKAILEALTSEKNNKGAAFTIQSRATGKDYTYRIKRSLFDKNNQWYTHVYVEQMVGGERGFVRLGTYAGGEIKNKGVVNSTPAAIALAWVLKHVEKGAIDWVDAHVDVMHLGKCLVCNKTLTDAISIETGLGPVCDGGRSRKKAPKGILTPVIS